MLDELSLPNLGRNEKVDKNIPLVTSCVMKLNKGVFDPDLFQEGCLALINAVDRFDVNKGFKFSTYASFYIEGAILKYKNTNTSVRPIRRSGKFIGPIVNSIHVPLCLDKEVTLEDVLSDTSNSGEHMVSVVIAKEWLNLLPVRERNIVMLRIEGRTIREIADILDVSRATVSNDLVKIRNKYSNMFLEVDLDS